MDETLKYKIIDQALDLNSAFLVNVSLKLSKNENQFTRAQENFLRLQATSSKYYRSLVNHNWGETKKPERNRRKKPEWNKTKSRRPNEQQIMYFNLLSFAALTKNFFKYNKYSFFEVSYL